MSSSLPEAPRIDPRVRRTRQQLGQAFLEVVREKGFQALAVQDVTERAGVNRTTFYLHFPDKYALAEFSIGQSARQDIERHLPDIDQLTLTNLRGLIFMVFEFVRQSNAHPAVFDPQFNALVEAQVRQQVQALLQKGLQRAENQLDSQMTSTAASWAIYGVAQQWLHDGKRTVMESQVDRILPLVAAMLGLTSPATTDSSAA
jgi:AcrR family transcriptional regulator